MEYFCTLLCYYVQVVITALQKQETSCLALFLVQENWFVTHFGRRLINGLVTNSNKQSKEKIEIYAAHKKNILMVLVFSLKTNLVKKEIAFLSVRSTKMSSSTKQKILIQMFQNLQFLGVQWQIFHHNKFRVV
jgi:hypothetical protein